MDARQCIQWGFFLLFAAVIIALYRQTKSALTAIAFAAAVSQLNPLVVASCFQYCACFYIAFTGMLLVPTVRGRFFTHPVLFFVIGLATQIFDFYTAPALTLGLPLVMLLLLPGTDSLSCKARWKLVAVCSLTWIAGYIGAWFLKMLLTSVFTPYNALYDGLSRLRFWLTPSEPAVRETGLALKAMYWCTINIVDLVPLILEGLLLLLYLSAILLNRPVKRVFLANLPFLAVALLPYLWFAAAAKPSYEQFYFQYRSLGVFLFAGFVYLLRTTGRSALFFDRK